MSAAELDTVVRLGLPLVVVVYNDDAYGAEVHHFGPDGVTLDTVGFPDTDLAAIARGFGFHGVDGALTRRPRRGAGLARRRSAAPMLIDAKVADQRAVVVARGGVPGALSAGTARPGCEDAGVDLETFRWLLTDDGQALLAAATAAEGSALQVQAALRETAQRPSRSRRPSARSSSGPTRRRSSATTRPGCTSPATASSRPPVPPVANHRAARLAVAGPSVIDLTCGIGGDLVAFARAGPDHGRHRPRPAPGRDGARQPRRARSRRRGAASPTRRRSTSRPSARRTPTRRGAAPAGRSFRADDWTPPWTFVESLLTGRACVKVAPGIPHSLVPDGVEAEWVSDHGEVKEAALWSPRLATVVRRATVIGARRPGDADRRGRPRRRGRRRSAAFLYEPDGAVIRAGLVTAVAAGVGRRTSWTGGSPT